MEHKLPTENSNWLSTMAPSLQKETFEQLMNFQLPALKIEQFATQEECDAMVKALDARQFGFSEMQSPPIGRIGITQFSYSKSSPEQYFSDLPRQHDDVEAVFAESFNPVQRILEHLQEVWPHSDVSIASCPKHGNYGAGIIRHIHEYAGLHFDYVPIESEGRGFSLENITAQLAWNLHLSAPESGGECVVYDRHLQIEGPMTDQHKLLVDTDLVNDRQSYQLRPAIGDVMLLNTRNYHEIMRSNKGRRITVSSFVGVQPDGKLVIWS